MPDGQTSAKKSDRPIGGISQYKSLGRKTGQPTEPSQQGYSDIKVADNPSNQIADTLDSQQSSNLDIQSSSNSDSQVTGNPSDRQLGNPNIGIVGNLDNKISSNLELRKKEKRVRVQQMTYLAPELKRWLQIRAIEESREISEIVEQLVMEYRVQVESEKK